MEACNVGGYRRNLVARLGEVVGEAGAGGKAGGGDFRRESLGATDGSDPGAALGLIRAC
jgi:hypothetical protein